MIPIEEIALDQPTGPVTPAATITRAATQALPRPGSRNQSQLAACMDDRLEIAVTALAKIALDETGEDPGHDASQVRLRAACVAGIVISTTAQRVALSDVCHSPAAPLKDDHSPSVLYTAPRTANAEPSPDRNITDDQVHRCYTLHL